MSMVRWLAVLANAWWDNNNDPVAASSFGSVVESIRERPSGNNTPPRAGERSVVKTPLAFQWRRWT